MRLWRVSLAGNSGSMPGHMSVTFGGLLTSMYPTERSVPIWYRSCTYLLKVHSRHIFIWYAEACATQPPWTGCKATYKMACRNGMIGTFTSEIGFGGFQHRPWSVSSTQTSSWFGNNQNLLCGDGSLRLIHTDQLCHRHRNVCNPFRLPQCLSTIKGTTRQSYDDVVDLFAVNKTLNLSCNESFTSIRKLLKYP